LSAWTIRSIQTADFAAVRALILEGLGDRFGRVESAFNPDLDDLQVSYLDRGATFIVATVASEAVIGCGVLLPEGGSTTVGRLVRMSVRRDWRGHGLGRALCQELIAIGRRRGFGTLLVETNEEWTDALNLYRQAGFVEYGRIAADAFDFVEVHLALLLLPVQ
jgi:GNAT superfamily N-acetyltransferase